MNGYFNFEPGARILIEIPEWAGMKKYGGCGEIIYSCIQFIKKVKTTVVYVDIRRELNQKEGLDFIDEKYIKKVKDRNPFHNLPMIKGIRF